MSNPKTAVLIRHDRHSAIRATFSTDEHGAVTLQEAVGHNGYKAHVTHLLGARFPEFLALKLALLASMKDTAGDTLDRVLLSEAVYAKWMDLVKAKALTLQEEGYDSSQIPDEQARPVKNGRLLLWVDIPGKERLSLLVPGDQWSWREGHQEH